MSRLVRAEVLKLRRRNALIATTAVLTVLAVAIYYAIMIVLHATDPSGHAAAGGLGGFDNAMGVLSMSAAIAGVLVGATAGGADIEAGVFRDLAATGRSRTALFAARLPGAWAIVVPFVLGAVALSALLAGVLDGPGATIATVDVLSSGGSALAGGMLLSAATVGLAAVAGARGMVIGWALAFQLGLSPILAQIEPLGAARQAIPQVAVARLAGPQPDGMLLGTAVLVIFAWAACTLGAGLWRTRTQEI